MKRDPLRMKTTLEKIRKERRRKKKGIEDEKREKK